jgi:hypothetical protein
MSDESEDDDRDKKMIGTEISQERFDRWEKAIEENNEITSKAQAIRVGVEQLLFSDDEQSGQNIDIEQILTRLDDLEQDIAEVRGDVITTKKSIPDVEEIAEEVIWERGKIGKGELAEGNAEKPEQRDHGRY